MSKVRLRKKGISLVALVITIIVLIILTGAVVITGISVPKKAQLTVFYNNVATVQDAVSLQIMNNMMKKATDGSTSKWEEIVEVEETTGEVEETTGEVEFTEMLIGNEQKMLAKIAPTLLDKTTMEEGEKDKYYVDEAGVVYYKGFEFGGETYYNQNSKSEGRKLIIVLPQVNEKNVTIASISWSGINATVGFETNTGLTLELSTNGTDFSITNPVTVVSGTSIYARFVNEGVAGTAVIVATPTFLTDGTYNAINKVNSPRLADDMVAVYWEGETPVYSKIDGSGNPNYTGTTINPNFDYAKWYDYKAQTGATNTVGSGTSRWANAMTSDGSYWVWIPRYAYSITSGYHGQGLIYDENNVTT